MKKKLIIGASALALCLVLILIGVNWEKLSNSDTAKNSKQTSEEQEEDNNDEIQEPADNTVDFNTSVDDNTQDSNGVTEVEVSKDSEQNEQPEKTEQSEQLKEPEVSEEQDQSSGDEGEWTGWY